MESLRVFIVSETPLKKANGVTTSILQAAHNLIGSGHEVNILAPKPSPQDVSEAHIEKTEYMKFFDHNIGYITSRRIDSLLERFEPDVVHLGAPISIDVGNISLGLGGQALRSARRLSIPTVAIWQTDTPGYIPVYGAAYFKEENVKKLQKRAIKMVRGIHNDATLNLAPSDTAKQTLKHYGVEAPIELWGRGIDPLFNASWKGTEAVESIRRQLIGGSDSKQVALSVGRLAPEKRFETLAALEGLDIRNAVVGKGDSYAAVQVALGDQGVMMGELRGEDLAQMYGAADMFIHTGNTETLGQVLQEAMASGLPVVAPRAGGPINLVRHGETGFLYDPDDPSDLRSKVEQLLADKDLRTRMGQLGLESVRSRTWPAVIDQLVGHYRSAIATYKNK